MTLANLVDKVPFQEQFDKLNLTIDQVNVLTEDTPSESQSAPRNKVVLYGDSLTLQNLGGWEDSGGGTAEAQCPATGYFNWARGFAKGRYSLVANHGVGGERTDQMLARIDDVLAEDADICIICGGRNDVSQQVTTFEQFKTSMDSMITQLTGKGMVVIVLGITPQTLAETDSRVLYRGQINQWVGNAPQTYKGVYSIDIETMTMDFTDGKFIPGSTQDEGTHWGTTTAAKIGRKVADVLDYLGMGSTPRPAYPATSPLQIGRDPIFQQIGWYTAGADAAEVGSSIALATSDDFYGANKLVMTIVEGTTGYAEARINEQAIQFTAGDQVQAEVDIEWDIADAFEADCTFGPECWLRINEVAWDSRFFDSAANMESIITDTFLPTGRMTLLSGIYTVTATPINPFVYLAFNGIKNGVVTFHRYNLIKVN